jgi:hypothetical protein
MIWARRLAYASMIITVISIAAGYLIGGYGKMAVVLILLGCAWIGIRLYRNVNLTSYSMLAVTGLVVFGFFIDLLPGLMLITLVSALAAWDLEYFLDRMVLTGDEGTARALERQHLQRLGVVCGLGLLISGVTFTIQLHFSVGWAILAGLFAIVGFRQVIGFFGQESD